MKHLPAARGISGLKEFSVSFIFIFWFKKCIASCSGKARPASTSLGVHIPSFAQPNVTPVQHDDDTWPLCPFIDRHAPQPLLLILASQWTDAIRPAVIAWRWR
ncbi:uncharacterized protein B0T23DRAFT_393117 [Neurospora hispaniola]|uniref:Uncharacterized protein n=1 Tax=Neurospora hispaniola TaxID=588809 RepID=A0AAJ0MTP9_9PEZI|nr:hypothetical protein B0T23DRAFT_393117 [Neurospora hispaniola]